ncbi:photosynthetic reaction center cytochrome PufC [Acetobacteraceae bacterium KSS8]|uniref:Photosynthetic reaction center cytochrome c subunit n=1 Tax=Endosaccharibacter trunci TaxID=2812733 RepID=A0ABT1W3Q5_9PROT|nr:photosynthetic reaction center cytochrome PufC [Acetobacteraceae bacterium KSS8]
MKTSSEKPGLFAASFAAVARAIASAVGLVRTHPWLSATSVVGFCAVIAVCTLALTLERPPLHVVQTGFRGTGMQAVFNDHDLLAEARLQHADAPLPAVQLAGRPASEVYKNVKVLGAVDANEFLRLMAAMTQWVAPATGCAFCHSLNNMADDSSYNKIVARRMLQMTADINRDWKAHVGEGGVTCQTCHRGETIPSGAWFVQPAPYGTRGLTEADSGQNIVSPVAGLTSLPYDPLTPFLLQANPIRVTPTSALPSGGVRPSINQTDWTYALMIHFSDSLGVNCTFCHNTRAFEEWDQSTPHRVTAWHGISMVRAINRTYMNSLVGVFPRAMRGPLGDEAKVSCDSCHAGAYKPFFGASTLSAYPALSQVSQDWTPPAAPGGAAP